MERFLYRLGESDYREHFVLKGGMLLVLWGEEVSRPTRDLDFTGYGNASENGVRSIIREICSYQDLDDGIIFDTGEIDVSIIRPDDKYDGYRACFQAAISGARILMRIDIGFGDVIYPAPVDADYPTLLDFPCPRILTYPRESVVAEKLHAMISHGAFVSRYKDFYDLHLLAQHFPFEGGSLSRAIAASFGQRGTTISENLPIVLTPEFYSSPSRVELWRNYLGKNRLSDTFSDFRVVGESLLSFLAEPWNALARSGNFSGSWPEGGPWLH